MANLKLDLSQDYATQMLSFYLYGEEGSGKVIRPSQIADSKWIRTKDLTVDVDSVDFLEKTGLKNFNPYEFYVIQRFFKNQHESNTTLLVSDFQNFETLRTKVAIINDSNKQHNEKELSINKNGDGTYSLNYQAFRHLFYNEEAYPSEGKNKNNFKISAEPTADYYFYHGEVLNKENFNKNAFVFGSSKLTFDTDKIQFVIDESGNPIRIDNFIVKPATYESSKTENFDYEGGTEVAEAVNHLLRQITDPSGIGRKVKINYINEDSLINNAKTVFKDEVLLSKNYSKNIFEKAAISVFRLSGFLQEFERIKDTGVIDYLDETGKVVIFDGNAKNILTGTTATNLDLKDSISPLNEEMLYNALGLDIAMKMLLPSSLVFAISALVNYEMHQLNHYRTHLENYRTHLEKGITYIGGNGDDTITGTDKNDHLFGNNNSDTLKGKEGNDYLEGGTGFDTYVIQDKDTIFDSDMNGSVWFGTKNAGIFSRKDSKVDIWNSTNDMTATRQGNDLLVKNGEDAVTIKDYFKLSKHITMQGSHWSGLGIHLIDDTPPTDANTETETFAKPQNNSFVLRFSLFQHKHNKIKQNNHTNLTITAHFQAALCSFRQQSAQQALTCLPL